MLASLSISALLYASTVIASPIAEQQSYTKGRFAPDNSNLWGLGEKSLPAFVNLTESHTYTGPLANNSYWSSSFIHGSNGHDYVVLAHALDLAPEVGYYRGSILDITNPSHYSQFEFPSKKTNFYTKAGVFNATFPNFGMGTTSATDPISELRTWSTVPGTEFDITFETSSPVMLNGGLGQFFVGLGPVNEWSMPAGRTRGHIVVDGAKVEIDSANSLTWYDRQWGSSPDYWTWFELHVPSANPKDGNLVMSIWVYGDGITGDRSFATVRDNSGAQQVIPAKSRASSRKTWKSSVSGVTYPQAWELELQTGLKISVASVRGEQELVGAGNDNPTYEGYTTVSAVHPDGKHVEGFGLVEMKPTNGKV